MKAGATENLFDYQPINYRLTDYQGVSLLVLISALSPSQIIGHYIIEALPGAVCLIFPARACRKYCTINAELASCKQA